MPKALNVTAAVAGLVVSTMAAGGALRAVEPQFIARQSGEPAVRLSPTSPLAANRLWVFAVAADGVTVVRQSLSDEGSWRPLPPVRGGTRITGLAATDETLYVADAAQHRIMSINLATGEAASFAALPPSYEPTDLAYTNQLFFADASRSDVYRWSGTEAQPLSPAAGGRGNSTKHIAGAGNVLLMSSPDDGAVWQTTPDASGSAGGRAWFPVQRPSPESQGPVLPTSGDIIVSGDVSFPLRPTAVASSSGVIYVVDNNSNGVFAYSRYWLRPVRLQFGPRPVTRPTRIVATANHLLILDGPRGAVERWPRFVPTRVNCSATAAANEPAADTPPCARSQFAALAAFFTYLNGEQYLPTKKLSGATTLAEAIERGFPSVTMRDAVAQTACALNRSTCAAAGDTAPRGNAADSLVPDVYGESYVDIVSMRLSGRSTLGAIADAALPSPEFRKYADEEHLSDLNGPSKAQVPVRYRNLSQGPASVPVELVRFVVGIPEDLLRTVRERFPALTFVPLAEAAVSRAAAEPAPAQNPDLDRIQSAHKEMRSSIGGQFDVVPPSFPYVGVAEHDIDMMNPDLADAFSDAMAPVRSSATPAPQPTAAVDVRDFREDDHGTAVASLIAARPTAYDGPALGAGSLLLAVSDNEPTIGESIRQAYVNQRARIFNLSFHFGASKVPRSLKDAIEQYTQALFVVAAGNDTLTGPDGHVCATFEAFPVCWGDRANVLVVTATTLDGANLLPPNTAANPATKGANWSDTVVHVAAPGDGFYASGRDHTYVRVSGSSFATPLVTGVAALLYAQGVRTPWEIKQRIMTTADQVAGLTGRVVSGRLNARRASTNLSFALVVNELKAESAIALDQSGVLIQFSTPTENFAVALSNIRRLTRGAPGKYTLVYVDGDRLKRVEVNQAQWPFRYFELDAQKRRKGPVKNGDLSTFVDYIGPIL
jgi:subtilase family protein